ncbi:MAG: alpha-L-fucosidase [Bacteroidota bacterium]
MKKKNKKLFSWSINNNVFRIAIFKTILACLLVNGTMLAQENTNKRAEWFTDSRFGMFIHWGIYSGAEGIWKGEKIRHDNNYAEWIYYRNRIDKEEYVKLLNRFEWDAINPEEWVLLAKKAGMKYITLTAKHHDGFALWDSQVSDYDLGDYTSGKRDIVKELAEACAKHDMKLGLYYSHWVDWEHEYGWDHSKEIHGLNEENFDKYWQEKVIPQMRELLTDYGKISMIWFDMWMHHSKTVVKKDQLLELKGLIRKLQPECLVNSRLGLSIEEDSDIDYKTLRDNHLGESKEDFPWQTPATVAHSWGFNAMENQWKSTTTLLQSLIGNVSLNGNMMLNIGPRANGEVPYEIRQRLEEIGQWLTINGNSIYGAQAFDLSKDMHDWGKITCKKLKDGKALIFLHVHNWPLHKQLPVTGIKSKPKKIYLLADKQKVPLDFHFNNVIINVDLPEKQPDEYISTIVLEFDSYPDTEVNLVAKSTYGGYSLTPNNLPKLISDYPIVGAARKGTVPDHIKVKESSDFQWRIYVENPISVYADVSYSSQSKQNQGKITIKGANLKIDGEIRFTGSTVGEPNLDWHIDSFNPHRIGVLDFPKPGYYDITLNIVPDNEKSVDFQWLFLSEN